MSALTDDPPSAAGHPLLLREARTGRRSPPVPRPETREVGRGQGPERRRGRRRASYQPRHARVLSGPMEALGRRFVLPFRWGILAGVLLVTLGVAFLGRGVAQELSTGGFTDEGSDSARAAAVVAERFPGRDTNLILLLTAESGDVDDPAAAAEGQRIATRLAGLSGVRGVSSYWSLGSPPALRSDDGDQALVLADIPGDDDEITAVLDRIDPELAALGSDTLSVQVGGRGQVFRDIADQVEHDLRTAELLAFPITGLLLMLVFGSLVAAGLPLVTGIVTVVGTVGVLFGLAAVTDVSVFALNLATGLGLGLSIDYSLFMLTRFREERRTAPSTPEAVVATMRTAGRAILVSGVTVGASLSALLIFPLPFLRSFAYAGLAVSLLAVLNAVVVLPALLLVLDRWVDRFPLLPRRWRRAAPPPGSPESPDTLGAWGRLAQRVMRSPVRYLLAGVAVLLILGAPFWKAHLALPDDRVLPPSAPSRQVQDTLRAEFPDLHDSPVLVVVPAGLDGADAELGRYARALSRLPDVARVDSPAGVFADGRPVGARGGEAAAPPAAAQPAGAVAGLTSSDATLLVVEPSVEAMSGRAEALVEAVRALPGPAEALVGGRTAELIDVKAALAAKLPWAMGLIAGFTFLALLLMFGSVLVPLKALVLNTLSLSATFGAMVWIFQEGRFSDVLNFTPTGTLDTTIPILMFCMAFGLSMDYEVFIMSRIKEAYDRHHDSDLAVVEGIGSTGGLVTSLAVILAVVFACFATSDVTFIKLMGIGLAMAVLVDATIARGILVPAMMRLGRRANWWAPRWARRLGAGRWSV